MSGDVIGPSGPTQTLNHSTFGGGSSRDRLRTGLSTLSMLPPGERKTNRHIQAPRNSYIQLCTGMLVHETLIKHFILSSIIMRFLVKTGMPARLKEQTLRVIRCIAAHGPKP